MIHLICLFDQIYDSTGSVVNVDLEHGLYHLQLWGAQGGSLDDGFSLTGSMGGYANGTVMLHSDTTLFLFVGGQGETMYRKRHTDYNDQVKGGWNGGGTGGDITTKDGSYHQYYHGAPGGGGTDISFVSSPMSATDLQTNRDTESLEARLIVAGAYAFSHHNDGIQSKGEAPGGGLSGCGACPGTQKQAGAGGSFSNGANWESVDSRGGGGGGWFGGGNIKVGDLLSGGGSGYLKFAPSVSGSPGGQVVLLSGNTIPGNETFLSPTGVSELGHAGNGAIRITQLEIQPTPAFSVDFVSRLYEGNAFVIICISGLLCIPIFDLNKPEIL